MAKLFSMQESIYSVSSEKLANINTKSAAHLKEIQLRPCCKNQGGLFFWSLLIQKP